MVANGISLSDTNGPAATGIFFQALELGIIISQSYSFWTRAEQHLNWLNGLVAYVTIIAMFQTCAAFYSFWKVIVLSSGFSDWPGVPWPDVIQPVVVRAMLVQALIPLTSILDLCDGSSGTDLSRLSLLAVASQVIFGVIVTSYFIISILATISVFHVSFETAASGGLAGQHTRVLSGPYIASLIIPTVLDAMITGTLLTVLVRVRKQVYAREMKRKIHSLIILLWEAALPPFLCALAGLIAYVYLTAHGKTSYWDMVLQNVLGKLYVISLFVTLNGQAELSQSNRSRANESTTRSDHQMDTRAPPLSTQIWVGSTGSSQEDYASP
ncbi:hypothetical protein K488DRAFT_85122 [Vararia minispora EC-137]|uniref:Uncharacterized protein n=1 Tax=Vararia minispora EC-137 TaxID=1314806 RepID=A0ACB8QPA5_9AGAM|nr:hypothetical protein K488DRAFT_85122 [Vararia minispora EC-137]